MILKPNTKILLVEVEVWYQQIFQMILQDLGYLKIETDGNGVTVVEKAREYLPHVILMDTHLPGQEGYEACRQMRAEEWGKHMTILGMSTAGSFHSKWRDAGADGFFYKDVFLRYPNKLDEKIQQALEKYVII